MERKKNGQIKAGAPLGKASSLGLKKWGGVSVFSGDLCNFVRIFYEWHNEAYS